MDAVLTFDSLVCPEGSRGQGSRPSSRRSVSSMGTAGVRPLHPSQQSIIARMLSSPDSLLIMSLTKSNFAQAAQVIKVCVCWGWGGGEEVRELCSVCVCVCQGSI